MNDTKNPINLADIYRKFSPATEYRLFSGARGTFSRSDHKLSYKKDSISLKDGNIQSMFSNYKEMALGINNRNSPIYRSQTHSSITSGPKRN